MLAACGWKSFRNIYSIKVHPQLRLVFPTLQENSSPLGVITHFLETLGRKIDQADLEKVGSMLSCLDP